jgi:hypothetical protein
LKTPINLKPLISLKKLAKPFSDNTSDLKNYLGLNLAAKKKFTARRSSENAGKLLRASY